MRQRMLISRQRLKAPPPGGWTASSEYLRMVAGAAETRGLKPLKILKAAGIDPSVLHQRALRVAHEPVSRAWAHIVERLGDPLFGLALVDVAPFGAADLLDYVLRNCANAGESLRLLVRFGPLMNAGDRMALTVSGGEARMRFRSLGDVPYTCEMVSAIVARRCRQLLGPSWSLLSVSFAHAPLGPRAAYDRAFQASVRFQMPWNEIVFRRELLELPMPGADARLKGILMVQAEDLLATLAPPASAPSFVERVQQALADGMVDGDASLNRLADHLRLGTRTIQRRLREAGVTHRALVRQLRLSLAARSLAGRDASQREIARALGYSGAGAFHRAFKRWSGMTPGQVRARGVPPW